MPQCNSCRTILGEEVRICPICNAVQNKTYNPGLDNVDKKLVNTPTVLSANDTESIYNNSLDQDTSDYTEDRDLEIARLMKRGDECFSSGKAWIGAKDRSRARKEFQRALNYYETVLKLDPDFEPAREARAKCLFKMA